MKERIIQKFRPHLRSSIARRAASISRVSNRSLRRQRRRRRHPRRRRPVGRVIPLAQNRSVLIRTPSHGRLAQAITDGGGGRLQIGQMGEGNGVVKIINRRRFQVGQNGGGILERVEEGEFGEGGGVLQRRRRQRGLENVV